MTFSNPAISFLIESKAALKDLTDLLRLRAIVGYLGEQSQLNWWSSDFFAPTADAFLEPIFPRTMFQTQVAGVSAAAAQLHDEHIGVGNVFHLFRLPEEFEQSFHQRLHDADVREAIVSITTSQEAAIEFLDQEYGVPETESVGPVSYTHLTLPTIYSV